jgi:hypothetical protein
MTHRTRLTIIVKAIDLNTSCIYSHKHMVGMDKIFLVINHMWFFKKFKMTEILCIITFDTIFIYNFDTKCVQHNMETPMYILFIHVRRGYGSIHPWVVHYFIIGLFFFFILVIKSIMIDSGYGFKLKFWHLNKVSNIMGQMVMNWLSLFFTTWKVFTYKFPNAFTYRVNMPPTKHHSIFECWSNANQCWWMVTRVQINIKNALRLNI